MLLEDFIVQYIWMPMYFFIEPIQ